MMMFRILGPVRLHQQEHEVKLSPAKIRGLLAILLLSANRSVPIDSIIDRLWDTQVDDGPGVKGRKPPPDARRTLQSYVSRLRGALKRWHVPARILTEAGHYRLKIEDKSIVDYYRFRTLAAEGQQAFRVGDHRTAIAKLGAAVDLWQGRPMADVTSSWAQRTAESLSANDLLPAYYNLVRAHLALGDAERALDILGQQLGVYSTDITLIELRMQALTDFSGSSSAVGYFHDVVDDLPDEFAAQLRRTYDRLMAGGSATESADRGRPPEPVSAVPFQVPRHVHNFIGREDILQEMDERLAPTRSDVVVVLYGTPGVGKTTLTTYWTHRRADRFPDGVLRADLNGYGSGGPVTGAAVLAAFLTSVGVPLTEQPTDADGKIRLLRQRLHGKRMLVVLDNARDPGELVPLLAATASCPVLVTSRQQLDLPEHHHAGNTITVPTLGRTDAIDFLRQSIGEQRAAQDMDAVHDLATLCDGLPLALRIVGEHVATRSHVTLRDLATHLRRRILDAGRHGDQRSKTLRAVFDMSVDHFPVQVALFFSLLGLSPTSRITTEAAAALTGLSMVETEEMFDVLVGAHLVTQCGVESYTLHDLLYRYAQDRARLRESHELLARATHRLADWYWHSGLTALHTIMGQPSTISRLDEPATVTPRAFSDPDDARRWFLTEVSDIIGVCEQIAKLDMHAHLWRIVAIFSDLLTYYCHPAQIIDVHRQALTSAQLDGSLSGKAGMLNSLGVIDYKRDEYAGAEAYFAQALEIFRDISDEEGEAVASLNLATAYLKRGRSNTALEGYQRSLEGFERIDDRSGQARAYLWFGDAYRLDGDLARAAGFLRRSLAMCTEIADQRGQAIALAKLGEVLLADNNPTEARNCCVRAKAIGEKILDSHVVVEALRTDALAALALGEYEDAAASAVEAARQCEKLDDARGRAEALTLAGSAYRHLGDVAGERRALTTALELYESLHDPRADEVRESLRDV